MEFLYIATLAVVGFWAFRSILRKFWGTADRGNEEDATNKVVVITGANSGIGKATALEMAERGAIVVMACKDMDEANAAIINIRKTTGTGRLIPMKIDLASLDSVRQFASDLSKKFDKVDILINNAGVLVSGKLQQKTQEGFEINFGVNHLGHFLLTNLLLDSLKKAAPSRIVTVSSDVHLKGLIDFKDLMGENQRGTRNPIKNKHYANSKLANVLFSFELARKLWGTNVQTYCASTGLVKTKIVKIPFPWRIFSSLIQRIFFKTPQEGCQTVLHCALSKQCRYETGEMYQHCRKWLPEDRIPIRREVASRLWTVSEELVGLKKDK
ncbi:unnamed protein product [Allacma fusca]|uniref:Retinol dehydrogenase 13 n=1 Tax=Allacma fusca TaxID=39272 RepID=A0A8J2KZD6_9HEXA|nr:unnamed protein product [Allacma fusca]